MIREDRRRSGLLALFLASAAAIMPQAVSAQSAEGENAADTPPDDGIAEILVTAQRR
jgi:hypothetical protein